jgi:hypothetical protein
MSQGSNFKTQVMEALFNAPTNLVNNKAIMWALSNLPDEGGKGEHNTVLRGPFQHEAESFWAAVGMPGDDMESIHDRFRDELFAYVKDNNDKQFSKSMVFEHMEKKLGYEGIMYLAVHGFIKHYEALQEAHQKSLGDMLSDLKLGDIKGGPQDLDGLIKHLKELRKRLGGEE